jgi:two-component system phosphate regulon sensor histidine kinase PhoR
MKPRLLIAVFSFIVALCTSIGNLYFEKELTHLLFIFILVFLLCFLLFYYATEKFIYQKIQVIYKLISNLKIDKELKVAIGAHISDDPITDVELEVRKWTEGKKNQIEELKNLEKFRKEFLANISHELKTPLFGAQGYIQTALEADFSDTETLKHYLIKVDKNVERLCMLVSDLDEITNLETGEINLSFSNFNLKELILEIIDDFDLKSKQFNIKVFIDTNEASSQTVYADKEKVRQVFVNLFDNSLKYGNPDGETRISLFDMAENVLIEVTDNGIGIKENHLPRLFERFYRTDESRNRKIGGTGLGLAIVKHIIEAHNQTINVRSTYGLGTTFAFTLRKKLKN